MPTKHITIPLQQLKRYEEVLKRSIKSDEELIEDFGIGAGNWVVQHCKTMRELLEYIQNDIKAVEEYEEQLEAYRKQLEKEE